MSVILYDIPSTVPGIAWSPSTWKVRYCLNYKNIPYKTEWIEYPDIASHCQKLGIAPTGKKRDGTPYYSLPAIHDPSTGIYMADSIPIAEYLEKQYPDTPSVFPHNTWGFQIKFEDAVDVEVSGMWHFIIPMVLLRLNPPSQVFFRTTREKSFGKKMEEVAPTGEARVTEWAKIEKGMGVVAHWYSGTEGHFLMGETFSWADIVLGGYMHWFRSALGEDSKEWQDIMAWQDGFWKKFCEATKKYEAIL